MGTHKKKRVLLLADLTVEEYTALRKKWRTDVRISENALFCHWQTLADWKKKQGVFTSPHLIKDKERIKHVVK